ncbi:MAG: ferredoxin [Hydrocarboniphaga sp.]|nr:FAD-dependent oxidoreductase [Hydrocarboniphaga sp.]MDB5970136.1 ferredoxin [Hydrocarboniphaga sp.]
MSAPLRVAIVGSGPAGFYAANDLLKRDPASRVELFDRLPTPGGLVRSGVSPDHAARREVIATYERLAMASHRFRFHGNIEIGRQLTHEDLLRCHHAVIYACGSAGDRRLGIPGEDLPGSHAATSFVSWYNGHPDFAAQSFDLSCERAIVIGNGNVALDVARMLLLGHDRLHPTDVADHALRAFAESRIREVVVLGRRGAAQCAFTTPELLELGHHDLDVRVEHAASAGAKPAGRDARAYAVQLKLRLLDEYAARAALPDARRLVLRFLNSPLAIVGRDRVETLRVVRNRLVSGGRGDLVAESTGEISEITAGLVLRAVGYRGLPVVGLPFDAARGIVPNVGGRIVGENRRPMRGAYVAGWLKRGPSGVIGTNKGCSQETVACLLQDFAGDRLPIPDIDDQGTQRLLTERCPDRVDYLGWKKIDRHERLGGMDQQRLRVKLVDLQRMTAVASGRF